MSGPKVVLLLTIMIAVSFAFDERSRYDNKDLNDGHHENLRDSSSKEVRCICGLTSVKCCKLNKASFMRVSDSWDTGKNG